MNSARLTMNTTGVLKSSPWFIRFQASPRARLRLFCFPYAGGGANIYRKWAASLPDEIEVYGVQLPGRGTRLSEAPISNLPQLADAIAEAITAYLDAPFACFGHSMGAVIGFELIHRLRQRHGVEPVHLFVSGRCSPQTPNDGPITYYLPEPEFIAELNRLNGTPQDLLNNPELIQLMMPVLRADFEICQTYNYTHRPPMKCPITAFGGLQDTDVTRRHLESWGDQTNGPFTLRMFPGDHFFLHKYEAGLLQIISRELYQTKIPLRPAVR